MANCILSVAPAATKNTHQYRLPEADRQAILAKSDFSNNGSRVERQRLEFIKKNGCDFGQVTVTSDSN
jgi:hypothetical protein